MIYKHRIPVQQTSQSNVHDPCTFVVDVFNLIDNVLVDKLAEKKESGSGNADSQGSDAKVNAKTAKEKQKAA